MTRMNCIITNIIIVVIIVIIIVIVIVIIIVIIIVLGPECRMKVQPPKVGDPKFNRSISSKYETNQPINQPTNQCDWQTIVARMMTKTMMFVCADDEYNDKIDDRDDDDSNYDDDGDEDDEDDTNLVAQHCSVESFHRPQHEGKTWRWRWNEQFHWSTKWS